MRFDVLKLVGIGDKATLITESAALAALDPPHVPIINRLQLPEQLPIILAGPVLRTVTPNLVTIWMATSIDLVGHCSILDLGSGTVLAEGDAVSTKLGEKLFISLTHVTDIKAGSLPSGKLLAYNFDFKLGNMPGIVGFFGDTLLEPNEVALADLPLPTFFIASPGPDKRFLHASCRKLHAPGTDAIDEVESLISTTAEKLAERPSSLFLTGDQIYADDVDFGILTGVSLLGRTLLGWEETLPGPDRIRITDIAPGKRNPRGYGFSVDLNVCENHLIGFGEFAAMYLLAWNPVLWNWSKLREKQEFLRSARRYSPLNIRRVLANIPCCMQFDDHEITDDWNLHSGWLRDTGNPTARLIIANGVAAYWAFQACGNPLNGRDEPVRAAVLEYLNGKGVGQEPFRNALLGFRDWSYVAPSLPPVVVLDTRTCREFQPIPVGDVLTAKENAPPGLMDKGAFEALAKHIQSLKGQADDPLVIVSPAPFIGYNLVERIQGASADLGCDKHSVKADYDPEAWGFNDKSFALFIRVIARTGRKRVIILSGDVHYAFTSISRCVAQLEGSTAEYSLVQCAASALKNKPPWTLALVDTDDLVRGSSGSLAGMNPTILRKRYDFWNTSIMWRNLRMINEIPVRDFIDGSASVVKDNNFGVVILTAKGITHRVVAPSNSYSVSAEWDKIPGMVAKLG